MRTRLGVPAYAHPAVHPRMWQQLLDCHDVLAWVVINASSGPGTQPDWAWTEQITDLRARDILTLGYLDLAYGQRPSEQLSRDMRRWRDWYGVNAFFLDRVPSTPGPWLDRWHSVAVREPLVVANTGTRSDPQLWNHFWQVCDSEGRPGDRDRRGPHPHPNSRESAIIVYGLGQEWPAELAAELVGTVGAVWLSDGLHSNPYDALPSWFEQLVDSVRATGDQEAFCREGNLKAPSTEAEQRTVSGLSSEI